jgi:hypothetical protein
MSWDESIRESLQRAAPYIIWVLLALATSILVAVIRDPLSRVLREAREQLTTLRRRLLSHSAIALGRKFQRFWQARQSEPAPTVAGSIDRLAEALPNVGKKSVSRVAALQAELQKQLGILEALGLQPAGPRPGLRDTPPATPLPRGSWSKVVLLASIAVLTGAANSFLLNEFFQGVLTSDPLFPSAFPDLHVSHIFAVLIFMMEVAIGFALHHFAEEHEDESAARKLLAFAPWLVLVGLVCLEGWAYALLSYQIDIPERLNLSPNSGLYTFARYFLALFGAGLTLLLSSLGYLLGKEVDQLRAGSEARNQERLLKRYGWVISGGADQVERTMRALSGLRAAAQGFQLDLVRQFKREVDTTSASENLQAVVGDVLADLLDSPERAPLRSRAQALADMGLFTAAFSSLVVVSWVSVEYVAAFVRNVQGNRPSADLFGLVSGVVMTGFAVSAGYIAGHGLSDARHGSGSRFLPPTSAGRRLLPVAAVAFPIAAGAGLVTIAVANHTLGPSAPLNLLFGLLHAGLLLILGAGADAAMINTLHLLRLTSMYLERVVVSLGALFLWTPRVVLAVLEWLVRLVAVFGQLVVRPQRPVRYGVVEVSRGAPLPRDLRTPARRFTDKAYRPLIRGGHA